MELFVKEPLKHCLELCKVLKQFLIISLAKASLNEIKLSERKCEVNILRIVREGNPIFSVAEIKQDIDKGTTNSSYELWDDDYLKLISYLKNRDDYVSELGDKKSLVFVNGKKQITINRDNIDIKVR